jgi:glycosyltransferase involved in cell wall biosynthesis
MSNGISVIIPVHNEESSIRNTTLDISMQLERVSNSFEIVVVDDGSNDGTAEELKKYVLKTLK